MAVLDKTGLDIPTPQRLEMLAAVICHVGLCQSSVASKYHSQTRLHLGSTLVALRLIYKLETRKLLQ